MKTRTGTSKISVQVIVDARNYEQGRELFGQPEFNPLVAKSDTSLVSADEPSAVVDELETMDPESLWAI